MNLNYLKTFLFSVILLTLFASCKNTPLEYNKNTVGVLLNSEKALNGYTLFTVHKETYLISNCGEVVHQWTSKYSAGKSVYLLENGNLLRAAQIPNPANILIPSIGGRLELFDWDGNLIWEYNYSNNDVSQHHDVFPMPNGNVLMLAATIIREDEAIQMGRKLLTPPFKQIYNEQILELKPKNTTEADIVWEWNFKDHFIQDFDKTKDNYGNVGENPQLLDINFLGTSTGASWLHINSMQYNAELDQIVLSSKHLCEIYIIDHSTTTAEAASEKGGRYQEGGGLLYRWGNPMVYRQGTAADQKLFGPHYPHWIGKGLKDEGKIIVFNNGANRSPSYSEVNIITPPISGRGYAKKIGEAYDPIQPDYIYTAPEKTDFYSPFQSSAQQLSNGNIFVCKGKQGHFFEIDANENIVWEYISPIGGAKILNQGDNPKDFSTNVFRAKKYGKEYAAFKGRDLSSGSPIEKNPDLTQCNTL